MSEWGWKLTILRRPDQSTFAIKRVVHMTVARGFDECEHLVANVGMLRLVRGQLVKNIGMQ